MNKVPKHCDPTMFVDIMNVNDSNLEKVINFSSAEVRDEFIYDDVNKKLLFQINDTTFSTPEHRLNELVSILTGNRVGLLVPVEDIIRLGESYCFTYQEYYGNIVGSYRTGFAILNIAIPGRTIWPKTKVKVMIPLPTYKLITWETEQDKFLCLLKGEVK